MATQAQLAAVQQLYIGYLGRAADQAGQEFWANAIANGTSTIESVALGFTLSQEYQSIYGGLENAALVAKVYENLLDRAPDAEGQAFWVKALEDGIVTADTLVATMLGNLGTQDQQIVNNKVYVANIYTNTVGADYNAQAGADVVTLPEGKTIFDASVVTAKLEDIQGGLLEGQVPGLELIKAFEAAEAALEAYEEANTANVDALIAKQKETDFNTNVSNLTKESTYAEKIQALKADAKLAADDALPTGTTLNTLEAAVKDAQAVVDAQVASLNKDEKDAVAKYNAAFAANEAVKAPAAADVAAAKAGLAEADKSGDGLSAVNTALKKTGPDAIADTNALYDFYVNASTTADERAEINKAMKDVAFFNSKSFQDTAAADIAKNEAGAALSEATANLSGNAAGYNTNASNLQTAKDNLADAQKADATQKAVNAVDKAYQAESQKVADASKAIGDFNKAYTDAQIKVQADINIAVEDTVQDTFYFNPELDGTDYAFGAKAFGTGDSIVIASDIVYNSGALNTGNNNVQEFFLVQEGKNTLLVIETVNYGSNSQVGADASVITLTGVSIDQLSVQDGVVSFIG